MKKRIVSLLLIGALCLCLCPAAFAAAGFQDVASDDWYYKDVTRAVELGLMNGKGGGLFKPHDLMTEAEAATLAARLFVKLDGQAPAIRARKDGEPWYAPYVDYLVGLEFIGPLANPNDPATRMWYVNLFHSVIPEHYLEPINNVADGAIPDLPLEDGPSLGEELAVYDFYRQGILQGNDARGYFNPDAYIFRAEVAAILVRINDASARKHFSLDVGGLEGIRKVCKDNGDFCAIAFLGTIYEDYATLESRETGLEFLIGCPFVETDGEQFYAIIPADPGARVMIYEYVLDEQTGEAEAGELLHTGEPGEPVVVSCNFGEHVPTVRVFVEDGEGGVLGEFSPFLGVDGRLIEEEGVYDYSSYGEG